ncbi:transglycosylase SLT domain-containing protein [Desulfovibrio sp.]|uniref:transglycosylase SLT domain-containing protein n=1 Tax=Desulfovibrio sp. TaxID=885 RepID=UPI0023BF4289|nr:transglycosylase SLT domain-containing protein [Desulfovibrio sp.]MDE7241042.1 transglycosylase SLT domain-containing protein [Desulfovibrio sp.]
MPCRKTFVLCSLCLAGAGSALLLGLLSGFAPRGEGYEVRRRASARVVSLQASDLPAPILQAGDGSHVWAVRRPAQDAAEPGAATLAAAEAVRDLLAERRNGEFISFHPEGIRLSMAAATPLFGFEGAAPDAPATAGLAPLVALDGASAPQLLAVEPFRASDALDMDGRPVRWQDTGGLMAAYRPLAPRQSSRAMRAAPTAAPAPETAAMRAYASGDSAAKAHRYQELVENFSRRYDLNTALVYAIIHSESDFSPTLVSGKSAMGLMQLLPSTASGEVHRFLYGRRGDIGFDDLRVPEINIRYGTAYLHILLTRYFQNVTDPLSREYCTVAAYNMGPNRFLRLYGATSEEAVARINAMSADELYEDLTRRLPVRETRAYVAKVRRMKHHYAAQLDLPAALN